MELSPSSLVDIISNHKSEMAFNSAFISGFVSDGAAVMVGPHNGLKQFFDR